MERLKFYNIDDEYIKYLYQFDKKVPYNKNNKRPYIGIVLKIKGTKYFAPMFSPKQQHSKYKANATHINIDNNLGMIKLNNMIPVNEKNLRLIEFNKIQDKKYRNLLIQQNNFIQLNTDKIRDMANKLYEFVTVDKKDFFLQLSCDFELLEQKLKEYVEVENKKQDSNNKFIKDVEITCEVFEETSAIVKVLEDKGFKYVKEFTLNDIYMKNDKTNEFALKNGKITDSLIIRYVNEDDKKIVCKRRNYNKDGFEISTEKSVLKVTNIENAEKHLNILGYTRFLNMIDKIYMYENNEFIVYIQEVKDLGIFIELEAKKNERAEQSIEKLTEFVKTLNLKIGTKFDVRKAELLYSRQNNNNNGLKCI